MKDGRILNYKITAGEQVQKESEAHQIEKGHTGDNRKTKSYCLLVVKKNNSYYYNSRFRGRDISLKEQRCNF